MAHQSEPVYAGDLAGNPRKPWLQRLMDNPWLLLAIGLAVPITSYTLWGLAELMSMAAAKLP